MSRRKNDPMTAQSIRDEVTTWIKQDCLGGGAWSMFVMHTIKDMKKDYNTTMQYLSEMTKDHFDYVCEAIEEVVYHFQRMEMVKLIEDLYVKFYGDDKNTDFYHDNIEGLRNCIKKN